MVMRVLQNNAQIEKARQEMIELGVSGMESDFRGMLRKLRLVRGPVVGDNVKSWDVLSTVNFLKEHIAKQAAVLDIGCYASEVLISLHKLGYENLSGADLNPDLAKMPYQKSIHYELTNFMQTPFRDASFQAITSISVIEHGFNAVGLLTEMSRLLAPGGYFIASFDYWPEKLDTSDTKFFGMEWKIFSKEEVASFIELAAAYGLVPCGDLQFEGSDSPISCAGRQYTFGWLVLKRAD